MQIKMLKDSSWTIKGKIKTFKSDSIYTIDEIGDDKIFCDMKQYSYGVEYIEPIEIKEVEPIVKELPELEPIQPKTNIKKRGK